MSLDWEKRNREDRAAFIPSRLGEPASQAQLDYILGLAHLKNRTVTLPKTKRGAGQMIDRLALLPNVNSKVWYRNGHAVGHWQDWVDTTADSSRQELVMEIRGAFPQLTPMTVSSLVQLFAQIDELGMIFTFDSLMHEQVPSDADALILHVLARFLEEFSCNTTTTGVPS